MEEPLAVYEVLGAGPLRTRLQVTATRRGLTRFVDATAMEQLQSLKASCRERAMGELWRDRGAGVEQVALVL